MSKFDYRKLSPQERSELLRELFDVLDAAEDKETQQRFLLQLLTPSEAIMLARRWQIAKRLAAGDSYAKIQEDLGVGNSTMESVDRWLSEAIGDYRERLLEAQASEKQKQQRRRRYTPFPNTLPFVLLNLLADGALQWWATEALEEQKRKRASKKT